MECLSTEQIKLVNIIEQMFKPLDDVAKQKTILTTDDIYKKLQFVYPSEEYGPYDVYEVLSYLKVDGVNSQTSSKYFWLLQEI